MTIVVTGLSHLTASLSVREKVAVRPEESGAVLQKLLTNPGVEEGALLSTCNRVEAVLVLLDDGALSDEEIVAEVVSALATSEIENLSHHFFVLRDAPAVRHWFRVAASLDSMVVGEAQILGQVKAAYTEAIQHHAVGPWLHKLFQATFEGAKRVRTETQIGRFPLSIAGVMVEVAESVFQTVDGKSVLLLGTGEMAEASVKALASYKLRSVRVASRSIERARALAEPLRGAAIEFSEFPTALLDSDLVLVATAADQPVIAAEQIAALRAVSSRPLVIMDMSVPRNVAPSVGAFEDVFVYNLDDIQGVIAANRSARNQELTRAEEIVSEEVAAFFDWIARRRIVPAIQGLTQKAEEIRRAELKRVSEQLAHLSPKDRETIEALSRTLVNRLIHDPMAQVKSGHQEETARYSILQAFKTLFRLDDSKDGVSKLGAP